MQLTKGEKAADLVQGGLRDGVVLDAQRLLVAGQQGEDASQRGERGGQLVLQHVAVLLLQRAARQLPLNEADDGLQVGVRARHPQDDGVAITEPAQTHVVMLWVCVQIHIQM